MNVIFSCAGPTKARPPISSNTTTVEVGSISETSSHVTKLTFWQWGVDTRPLMDHGGRPPSGQALTLAAAQAAFRHAFFVWLDDLQPGDWERNRDYKKARMAPR